MSPFKTYARQARQRLKNDFWEEVKKERNAIKQLAESDVVSEEGLLVKQRQELKDKLYNVNHESDEEFFERVKALLNRGDVVVNPIAVLADSKALALMTESQKQAYVLKLSNRYQKAVERYFCQREK